MPEAISHFPKHIFQGELRSSSDQREYTEVEKATVEEDRGKLSRLEPKEFLRAPNRLADGKEKPIEEKSTEKESILAKIEQDVLVLDRQSLERLRAIIEQALEKIKSTQ